MKRILIMLALATAAAFALDAQIFPLMEARKVLQGTKGFIVTGQVTQKEVDTNDSTCRLGIVSFELPAKRAKVFDKVVEEYNRESPLSDGSHSFVAGLGMPAAERDAVPGIKAVKFYYFQGRPYIRTGDGHNFVSVRRNLDNPAYRTTTCIEWWPEDTLGFDGDRLLYGKVAGRIITVKGPIGDKAYVQKPKPVVINNNAKTDDGGSASFIAVEEIKELTRMYGLEDDPTKKAAIISSINERVFLAVSCIGREGGIKRLNSLFLSLEKLGGYRTDILFEENSAVEPLYNRRLYSFDRYDVYGVAFYPWSGKYGDESKNGHFVWYAHTHRLDASAPPLKAPVLVKGTDNYDPKKWQTFPVYSGFSTVLFPNNLEGSNKYAIWCTKDSTYLVETILHRRGVYRQESRDGICIRVCNSGKTLYPKSCWGIPQDTKYMISGHDNDYICLVTVFDALPPEASKIDIVRGSGETVSRNSCFNVPIAELQDNQQCVVGKPWILNRPDKVRKYIIDGRTATREEANAVKDINAIKLCPDGQLFIFSKQPEGVDTEPYYFVSFGERDNMLILVKMLPKGTDADASYSLEQIGKMLSVHDGVVPDYGIEIFEEDCSMGLLDEIRGALKRYRMAKAKTNREDMWSESTTPAPNDCPGHNLVEHTVHLDGRNHFILDGEDIEPRSLYGRVLKIVGREGGKSLCLFKISCDPASSFNYYCQIIKNMSRAEGTLQNNLIDHYSKNNLTSRATSAFAKMTSIRIVEDFYYDPERGDRKNIFSFTEYHVDHLVISIDGEQHPELMNLADVFNYLDKYDLVINEMSYYQKGAKLSGDTTFFDFTDSKPLELRITTTER